MLGAASSFSPTAKTRIGAKMPAARVDPIALTQFLINNTIVVDNNAPYGRSANSRAALLSGRGPERVAFASSRRCS
jgi:hypothetical protein